MSALRPMKLPLQDTVLFAAADDHKNCQRTKSFEAIWMELGRQVLERTIGSVPADRRKKKDDDSIWLHSTSQQSVI